MKERIAIVDGVRTPMVRAGTDLGNMEADELGAVAVKGIIAKTGIAPGEIDEVIIGNCAQPVHAANVSRVIAMRSGIPCHVPALTVQRNCASGMDAIVYGANRISLGDAEIIISGGVESMSNMPLLFNREMTSFYKNLDKSKSYMQTVKTLLTFRMHFLNPVIAMLKGLTDPISNQIMGVTAENLVKEFGITREEQDLYALRSHQRAITAIDKGFMGMETIPVSIPPEYNKTINEDNGPRRAQSLEALKKLKPYFIPQSGTVTAGNSSQITDGAAAILVMKESRARSMGFIPLGYLREYAFAGCDPHRMGLGPAFSTRILLDKCGLPFNEIGLIEINEAFAAQVLANMTAFSSRHFAQKELDSSDKLGDINPDLLNVNGGAIALGHPLGMTGTRITLTILKEMNRRKVQYGLATLCVGGGQGASLLLERE